MVLRHYFIVKPFSLGVCRDFGRGNISEAALAHIALTFYREGRHSVPCYLRQKRTRDALNTEGEACMLNWAFVPYLRKHFHKCRCLFVCQAVGKPCYIRAAVAQLCCGSHRVLGIRRVRQQNNLCHFMFPFKFIFHLIITGNSRVINYKF